MGIKREEKRVIEKSIDDLLLETKEDRRLLPNVPDTLKNRTNIDRRGGQVSSELENINEIIKSNKVGMRYKVSYDVEVMCKDKNNKGNFQAQGIDISMTGILLQLENEDDLNILETTDAIELKFKIEPGTMPEGMEMKVKILATLVRTQITNGGQILCGLRFNEELSVYSNKRKDRYMLMISSLLLFFITSFIILMRAESIIYFRFNVSLYFYSIMAAIFLLSRYLFAVFYKPIPIDVKFTPGVTIIIPCFNEEEWIQRTIQGCINQDYPVDKLEVIVVDDCSTDSSREKIREIVNRLLIEGEGYEINERLKYIFMEENGGKREALSKGVFDAKYDLVVFVDSDSYLDPFAIRNLVQPLKDPRVGGVSGRTDVANTYTNTLTKIQSVRYHIAFRVMKAAESVFDAVTCLSGPLACYRKELVLENMDSWLNQRFLGHRATFGDDRAMTNFVLKKHRTCYQDTAICSTIVPNRHKVFLKQQMRWKRSWLRESLVAATFMWKKEPFAAVTFYIGVIVPIFAPIVVIFNLVYVPIIYRVFPTTFLVGLLLMAMLMSIAQLFLRRSTTWIFGMLFCIYYEAVLLWQMPIAWVTFWKSTWGTRMTPSDEKEKKKREEKVKVFVDH